MPVLRRDFASRDELIAYLRAEFPQAAAVDNQAAEMRGGRTAAETALARLRPADYARTRNFLHGAVTRLSAYLRHGVLTLAEARDAALRLVAHRAEAEKFISELGWRDYWQRLYAAWGEGIWRDREAYKTGFGPEDYAPTLPDDVRRANTGLPCMDGLIRELYATGYLHNHARLWLAAYLIHWRRVAWLAGARWFLQHLLDGDPASNNLSWQWVASTFSHKPYFFNRDNLEKFSGGVWCRHCPLYAQACPFAGDYAALERRLFPRRPPSEAR